VAVGKTHQHIESSLNMTAIIWYRMRVSENLGGSPGKTKSLKAAFCVSRLRYRMRYRLICLFLLCLLSLKNLPAQHAPGIKWKEIETDRFIVIYPESLSDEVAKIAKTLDPILHSAQEGLVPKHQGSKWPLIFTDMGVSPNGFVSLMPRSTVWFAVPFATESDWWGLLARHEGRHIAQFEYADRGFTHGLRKIFGDWGWGLGIALALPTWLLEGDAVLHETILSNEGRGRDPLFRDDFAHLIAANPKISYYSAINSSFRRPIPSIYQTGYEITRWIYQNYGEEGLTTIYENAMKVPLYSGINRGAKKLTGKPIRKLFRDIVEDRNRAVATQPSKQESKFLGDPPEKYPQYNVLFVDSSDSLYLRKATISMSPKLVRIGADGHETPLIQLPARGRISMAEINKGTEDAGLRIAWNHTRQHPIFLGVSVSDINIVDLNEKDRVIDRRVVAKSSRYLFPSLSPNGQHLAVVELKRGLVSSLVVLDIESGEPAESVTISEGNLANPRWSSDGKKLVFSISTIAGRRIAEWELGSKSIRNLSANSYTTVKTPVYSNDGNWVFYSSNASGNEAIWAIPANQNDSLNHAHLVFEENYNVSEPLIAQNGAYLYAVGFPDYSGERPLKVALGNEWQDKEYAVEFEQADEPEELDTAEKPPSYAERDHKTRFRVHSLIPDTKYDSLALGIAASDLLGRVSMETGFLMHPFERSPGVFLSSQFTGQLPVFSTSLAYIYRSPFKNPSHYTNLVAEANYPINLARSGLWRHGFNPRVNISFVWEEPIVGSNTTRNLFPLAGYGFSWFRLGKQASRDLLPKWGFTLNTAGSHILSHNSYGDHFGADLRVFLPGVIPHSSLSVTGSIEHRDKRILSKTPTPRSYQINQTGTMATALLDYEVPLFYPDIPIGSLLHFPRARLGLFSDFGFFREQKENASWEPHWSTGATLVFDTTLLQSYPGPGLGVRFSWLWQKSTWRLQFMLMEVPIG